MSKIGYVFYDSRTDGEYIVVIEGEGTAGERQYRWWFPRLEYGIKNGEVVNE